MLTNEYGGNGLVMPVGPMNYGARQAMNKAPNERVRRALSEAMQEMERS